MTDPRLGSPGEPNLVAPALATGGEEPLLRVLLVDDDEEEAEIARDLLDEVAPGRFVLERVGTFEEGEQAIRRAEHDVALVDFRLGGARSGLELLEEAIAIGCRQPIILMTGRGDHDVDLRAMRAGAADYLVKGQFSGATLERSIRYAVERARSIDTLKDERETFETAIVGANLGLWDWNPGTGELSISAAGGEMLGGASVGRLDDWIALVHPEDAARLRKALEEHVSGVAANVDLEHRVRSADGEWRWVVLRALASRNAEGRADRIAGFLTDVTDRKLGELRLAQRAFTDNLTGLPNRALFLDRLEQALRRARRREHQPFAVCFIDLDGFKGVNDRMGHPAGDAFLCAVARRLEACIRPGDTAARFGGDEFALLLDRVRDVPDAVAVTDRLHASLAEPIDVGGKPVATSASVGIVLGPLRYDRPEDLLRDADTAMYRAKMLGKARTEIFDLSMHDEATALAALEGDLRLALEAGELRILWQPVVELSAGTVVAFEALLRWKHPKYGDILPETIFRTAETANLVSEVCELAVDAAVKQARDWNAAGTPVGVAVNLCHRRFWEHDTAERMRDAVRSGALPPGMLRIEVPEELLEESSELVGARLTELRAAGVRLHLDDFGAGAASLTTLHRAPFDSVKIDRSLVARLPADRAAAELVRSIVVVGRALGKEVIAEGVERPDQLDLLRRTGCTHAQGFVFSPAVEVEAATAMIKRVFDLEVR